MIGEASLICVVLLQQFKSGQGRLVPVSDWPHRRGRAVDGPSPPLSQAYVDTSGNSWWHLLSSCGSVKVYGMSLVIEQTQPVPLSVDADGVIRVTGTRVTLDTIAHAFERGATAEEMVQQFPTLTLADVYGVLGYLLRHQAEVAAYLEQRETAAASARRENERRFDAQGVRSRLLARRG